VVIGANINGRSWEGKGGDMEEIKKTIMELVRKRGCKSLAVFPYFRINSVTGELADGGCNAYIGDETLNFDSFAEFAAWVESLPERDPIIFRKFK
jgi:hypothetical protein